MTIVEARQLFAYGSWANALVFAAARELTADQLGSVVPSSFPSVAATLAHIVSAEWIWLRRWLGESPSAAPSWVAAPELAELAAQLRGLEAARDTFLGTLGDADLERPHSYQTLAGRAVSTGSATCSSTS